MRARVSSCRECSAPRFIMVRMWHGIRRVLTALVSAIVKFVVTVAVLIAVLVGLVPWLVTRAFQRATRGRKRN
jgi:hypothetical protein